MSQWLRLCASNAGGTSDILSGSAKNKINKIFLSKINLLKNLGKFDESMNE